MSWSSEGYRRATPVKSRRERRRERSAWVEAHREVSVPTAWFMRALGLVVVLLLTPVALAWGALRGAALEVVGSWRAYVAWAWR